MKGVIEEGIKIRLQHEKALKYLFSQVKCLASQSVTVMGTGENKARRETPSRAGSANKEKTESVSKEKMAPANKGKGELVGKEKSGSANKESVNKDKADTSNKEKSAPTGKEVSAAHPKGKIVYFT